MIDTDNKIRLVIRRTRDVFRNATGPRLRKSYMRQNHIGNSIDWRYALSADDIIENAIPSRVVGDIGRAKLFCKYASEIGLNCWVICAADYYDWSDCAHNRGNAINGRILIGVVHAGRIRAFDPFCTKGPIWFNCAVRPGNFIKILRFRAPYMISAIVPADDFISCDTYRKMQNLYAGGNMDVAEFTITPDTI